MFESKEVDISPDSIVGCSYSSQVARICDDFCTYHFVMYLQIIVIANAVTTIIEMK